MSHKHMASGETGDRRIWIAIGANGLLTIAQFAGGLLSGSLALIADALHNFSDMASLVIAMAARKIARRPADARMTYGYGRIEVVAALINYTTLILIALYLLQEGVGRLVNPPAVGGWTVVVLGGVALVVDAVTAGLTWSLQKDSVNMRALFLHNLTDALSSIAVVGGGILILLYDWRLIDPVVTLGIAGYILFISLSEIGGPIRTLMLGSPPDVDQEGLLASILAIDGVESVHHMHVWQMQEHSAALEAHIVLRSDVWTDQETIRRAIKQRLARDFDVDHTTLEFEREYGHNSKAGLYGCGACGADRDDAR